MHKIIQVLKASSFQIFHACADIQCFIMSTKLFQNVQLIYNYNKAINDRNQHCDFCSQIKQKIN